MHFKQNNKESKTYVQGLRPFGNTLPRGVRGILKKNGYNYSEIVSKWNLLVGNDIAKLSSTAWQENKVFYAMRDGRTSKIVCLFTALSHCQIKYFNLH